MPSASSMSSMPLMTRDQLREAAAKEVAEQRQAEKAKQELLQESEGGAGDLVDLDLADLTNVQQAAATVGERYGCLDLLINNAGVMAPPRRTTAPKII